MPCWQLIYCTLQVWLRETYFRLAPGTLIRTIIIILRGWLRTLSRSQSEESQVRDGHELAKVSLVVKFSLYQSFESCKAGEVRDYDSGKLFQTAGAACEKARSAKAG